MAMSKPEVLKVQGIETVDRKFSKERYRKATDFFYSTPFAFATENAPAPSSDSYASDEGSVQFHLIGQKPNDSKYSDIMNQNQDNLLNIGGLIHDYMHRKYPTVDSKTLDINTWANVVDNVPDLAIGKQVYKEYNNHIAGVSVSGEFLSIIAKAIITDGASILLDFQGFLSSIGNVIFNAHSSGEKYKVATCTYISYLIDNQAGGYYDYGAIVLRQIDFKENFMELKSSCSSTQLVNVSMSYTEIVNLVHTSRIRQGGPDYDMFQKLINKNATETFKRAENFFNAGETPQNEIEPKYSS